MFGLESSPTPFPPIVSDPFPPLSPIQHPVNDAHLADAVDLLERVFPTPLRTLDAVHLRIARDIGARAIATADATMATAAGELEMQVVSFTG